MRFSLGRAGQGKSRLLQSLSGLTSTEIPTGDRQHCTGVRCTIYHHPHLETYGEIWFHSIYDQFSKDYLGTAFHLPALPYRLCLDQYWRS